MSAKTIPVRVDELNAFRRAALHTWLRDETLGAPEGWSISRADPLALLGCFPALRLREGCALAAYQFREGDSGNGLIRAVAAGARGPMPSATLLEAEANAPLPSPLMREITGDGSAGSYAQASLFMRELFEFGAFGHGVRWLDAQLLDDRSEEHTS